SQFDFQKFKTPTGTTLRCKGWVQEAALRMLLNNLDPAVAERPEDLIVYGGRGKAARDIPSLEKIIRCLELLENNQSLLIQSGKPVAVLQTHEDAPRVLLSNSQLVPNWATWQHFDELEQKGLMMYGQMTAGSWIYIGSQGIVQGTYETFAAVADKHFGGSLAGTLSVTAGLGGMGGAQPLAITMCGGVALCAEVEEWRIDKRLETKYLDEKCTHIDEAIEKALAAKQQKKAWSIGVLCNAVELLQALIKKGVVVDVLTDQTSAHDPLVGYLPHQIPAEEAVRLREQDKEAYLHLAYESMYVHTQLMCALQDKGSVTFDYGNNLRARALEFEQKNPSSAAVKEFEKTLLQRSPKGTTSQLFPGFVPAYIRPLFCEGK
ncbi:MAG: urocanate hydratase, partial [Sphingobacteriia bacterium]